MRGPAHTSNNCIEQTPTPPRVLSDIECKGIHQAVRNAILLRGTKRARNICAWVKELCNMSEDVYSR